MIDQVNQADEVATSAVAYAETFAAIYRKKRETGPDESGLFDKAMADFRNDWTGFIRVEVNDGLDGDYDRFTLPEFQRELPGATGTIDLTGMLRTLDTLGFDGPIVVEPWNEQLRKMSPSDAIEKTKIALDRCLEKADIVRSV